MVRRILFLLSLIFYIQSSDAQVLEFSDLKKMPSSVNSNGEESMPLISPDQTKLFFVRSVYDGNTGGRYSGQDIWMSEKSISGWRNATNKFASLNSKDNNVLIGINADGNTIYMMNSSPSSKLEGFYFSKRIKNTWSKPEFISLPGIDNQDFVGMFVSSSYDVIFLSMRGSDSRGEEDLYISLKSSSGAWSRPKNMGATINTIGFEISPFLSADKKRLYFASNGHTGLGDADIFYCERLYNSWETWSAPINLGNVVNSKNFDAYFSIYGDSIAYFTSNRDQQLSDIYTAKVSAKNPLLASGQRYLSQEEWNTVVGKNVLRKMTFVNKAKVLSSAQKELLYYVANKISNKKDIGIHLVVNEEDDPELIKVRLREIYGELRQAGIESNRIREVQNTTSSISSNTCVIEVMLYK
jgi:hypothetical protein